MQILSYMIRVQIKQYDIANCESKCHKTWFKFPTHPPQCRQRDKRICARFKVCAWNGWMWSTEWNKQTEFQIFCSRNHLVCMCYQVRAEYTNVDTSLLLGEAHYTQLSEQYFNSFSSSDFVLFHILFSSSKITWKMDFAAVSMQILICVETAAIKKNLNSDLVYDFARFFLQLTLVSMTRY